jgi:TetR/AcrR family transcriptional regulator, cholesterol catabolism regulator
MGDRELKKRELLNAAAKLFAEKGFEATTIRNISNLLGRNQAMVYYYFTDKQALLFDAMSSGLQKLLAQILKIEKMDLPPDKKLELIIRQHISHLSSDRSAQSIAGSELRHLSPQNRTKFIAKRDKYEMIFRKVIQDGMDQGIFRKMDAKITAIFILVILNNTTRWYKSNGNYSLEEIGDFIIDFVNKAIR